jgi:hypothetical protein
MQQELIMVRIAGVVAAGLSHHLRQRGNRRQEILFCDDDCRAYIQLKGKWRTKCGAEVWHCRNKKKPFPAGRRGAPALHKDGGLSAAVAGSSMARAIWLLRDG